MYPLLQYGKYLCVPDPSNIDGFVAMTHDEFAAASEHITLETAEGIAIHHDGHCSEWRGQFTGYEP